VDNNLSKLLGVNFKYSKELFTFVSIFTNVQSALWKAEKRRRSFSLN